MHILLCTKYERYQGGAETYFNNLVKELGDLEASLSTYYFKVEDVRINNFWKLKSMVDEYQFTDFINKIKRCKPDVIHFNKAIHLTNRQVKTMKSFNIPILLTVHDCFSVPFNMSFKNLIKTYIYRFKSYAEYYIIPSLNYYNYLSNNGVQKISYIPHFVDLNEWHYSATVEKKIIKLLYVGRIEYEKGIILLLNVFKEIMLEYDSVYLTIIGDGSCYKKLKSEICTLNIGNRVALKPFMSKKDLAKYYNDSSILILPTLKHELFGLVGLEAQASGLPTIASNLPGINEWCIDGVTGVTFKSNDPVDLKQKILTLLSDTQMCNRIRQAAYYHVKNNFSKEVSMSRLLALYKTIHNEI